MDVIYIFDERYAIQDVTSDILELKHTEHAYSCFASFKARVEIGEGWCIGFRCIDGRFRLFEIDDASTDEANGGVISVNATDAAVRELLDEPLTDKRPTNMTPGAAVASLINDTRFTIGLLTAQNVAGSMRAYYESVWTALETARVTYNCEIVPYFEFENGRVSGRRIDVLARLGTNRGRMFEVGDDAQNVIVDVNYSAIKTALYGRGKGVEIEGDEDTGSSYGRRLTFSDVEWSVANGDPADKPRGQEWIGDPQALAEFGRDGRHRFDYVIFQDETDPDELLRLTWEALQERKDPIVTISATVADTESVWSRDHEAVRLGDDVGVSIPRRKVLVQARVIGIVRDYIRPAQTQLTIGNAKITAGSLMQSVKRQMNSFADRADVWDRAGGAFDIDGVMDVMNNQIKSTVGNWYTDKETGGIMFVSADEELAMRLTGAGWQIANGKTGGAWNWRTAATGKGLVADEITAGMINANVVNIGGTGTYLDGTSLVIQHPSINDGTRTEIGLDGFKMIQNGKVVGGLFKQNKRILSAVQALVNPENPQFRITVAPENYADEQQGLFFYMSDLLAGRISAYTSGGETEAGMRIDSNGSFGMYTESMDITSQKELHLGSNGDDITFGFVSGGYYRSFTAAQVYAMLARYGFLDD